MIVKFKVKDKNCPVTDAIEAAKDSLDKLEDVLNSEGTPIPGKDTNEDNGIHNEAETVNDIVKTDTTEDNKTDNNEDKTDITPAEEKGKKDLPADSDKDDATDSEPATTEENSDGDEQTIEVEEEAIAEVTEVINTLVEDAKSILENLSEGIIDTNSVKKLNDSCEKYIKHELLL